MNKEHDPNLSLRKIWGPSLLERPGSRYRKRVGR